MGSLAIQSITQQNLRDFLTWVHFQAPSPEITAIESEYRQRLQLCWMPTAVEVRSQDQPVVGVYFTCIPGDLAMLGGVRAVDESNVLAAELVKGQLKQIRLRMPNCHVQAAVEENDSATQRILRLAGFTPLTEVEQLWLPIDNQNFMTDQTEQDHAISSLICLPAQLLSRKRFEQILGKTFDGTLDCPELNGVRTHNQVLQSFLIGRSFRQCPNWSSLWLNDRPAGCLILTAHNPELVELAYMGLIPSARGRRLGRQLIGFAQRQAAALGASMLVVAVDSRNWPAMQLYRQCGFQLHRRLRVFWYR